MQLETITVSLPCHWITPVLYGDISPLEEAEARAFERWLRDTRHEVGHDKTVLIGSIHDQPYFARYHDAAEYGVLPCECVDVDLLVEA